MFLFKSSSRLLVNELPVMNEAEPATADSWLRRSFSTLKRCLREPLLHFLLIGVYCLVSMPISIAGGSGVRRPGRLSFRSTSFAR